MIDRAVYEIPTDLAEYTERIRSGNWQPDGLTPPSDSDVYTAALLVLRGRLRRKRAVKRLFKTLIASCYIRDCKLKFRLCSKQPAYMTDKGLVCFSLGSIFGGDGAHVLKLVFHEVAHLWLSEQKGYDRLKALQKAFRGENGNNVPAVFLPIEYYAVSLSAIMLEKLLCVLPSGTEAADITNQINCEKSKLVDFRDLSDCGPKEKP